MKVDFQHGRMAFRPHTSPWDTFYLAVELILSPGHGYLVQKPSTFWSQIGWDSPLFLQRLERETEKTHSFKAWMQKRRVLVFHCYLSSKNVTENNLAVRTRSNTFAHMILLMLFVYLSPRTWLGLGGKGVGMQGHLSWAHIPHLLLSWGMMDPEYLNPVTQLELKQKNGTLLWQWFKKKIK